jgi:hypothetical protein
MGKPLFVSDTNMAGGPFPLFLLLPAAGTFGE